MWCQIKADITGVPVVTFLYEETAALGAAMLAGLAIKRYESLDKVVGNFVMKSKEYIPNADNHIKYLVLYKKYRNLYQCMLPMFKYENE